MPKRDRDERRERERARLRRELGFDELTYEACIYELFGDLFGPPTGGARPRSNRVTQTGPGRRGDEGGVEADLEGETKEE